MEKNKKYLLSPIGVKIRLENIETVRECVVLDLQTGKRVFYHPNNTKETSNISDFKGFYYRVSDFFIALFPSPHGPLFYYDRQLIGIDNTMTISWLRLNDDKALFAIKECGLSIKYPLSQYLDLDCWSTLDGIDIPYKIAKHYKEDSFYDLYTRCMPVVTD